MSPRGLRVERCRQCKMPAAAIANLATASTSNRLFGDSRQRPPARFTCLTRKSVSSGCTHSAEPRQIFLRGSRSTDNVHRIAQRCHGIGLDSDDSEPIAVQRQSIAAGHVRGTHRFDAMRAASPSGDKHEGRPPLRSHRPIARARCRHRWGQKAQQDASSAGRR